MKVALKLYLDGYQIMFILDSVFYEEIKAGKGGIFDIAKSVDMIMGEVRLRYVL